jgi:hypothetical protein
MLAGEKTYYNFTEVFEVAWSSGVPSLLTNSHSSSSLFLPPGEKP